MKKWTLKNITLGPDNRQTVDKQVSRLVESIRKYGYVEGMPILVNKKGEIIDGQHRFLACKQLQIEPDIVEVDSTSDIIPVVNSTQLPWRHADYVKYYAGKGIQDYIILEQICKNKHISPKVVEVMITNKSSYRDSMRRNIVNPIRSGEFKIPDKSDKGLAKLERKITAILNVVTLLGLPKTERLILAICRLAEDKNFSFSVLESKINYQRSKIYRCTTIDEYKVMLATIYNYKNVKRVAI